MLDAESQKYLDERFTKVHVDYEETEERIRAIADGHGALNHKLDRLAVELDAIKGALTVFKKTPKRKKSGRRRRERAAPT